MLTPEFNSRLAGSKRGSLGARAWCTWLLPAAGVGPCLNNADMHAHACTRGFNLKRRDGRHVFGGILADGPAFDAAICLGDVLWKVNGVVAHGLSHKQVVQLFNAEHLTQQSAQIVVVVERSTDQRAVTVTKDPENGLGLNLRRRSGIHIVSNVEAGGAAETAGLRLGDILTKVGGRSTAALSHPEVVGLIKEACKDQPSVEMTVIPRGLGQELPKPAVQQELFPAPAASTTGPPPATPPTASATSSPLPLVPLVDGGGVDGGWNCKECTLHNKWSQLVCEVCAAVNPDPAPPITGRCKPLPGEKGAAGGGLLLLLLMIGGPPRGSLWLATKLFMYMYILIMRCPPR